MDNYTYAQLTGRAQSPPLPEEHTAGYLPQISSYSGSSNTRAPQTITYGDGASTYTGTSVVEYGSGSTRTSTLPSTRAPTLPSTRAPTLLTRTEALAGLQAELASGGTIKSYSEKSGIAYGTIRVWNNQAGGSTRTHRTYTNEFRASTLSRLEEHLSTGGSLNSYSRISGIPKRTLEYWKSGAGTSRGS